MRRVLELIDRGDARELIAAVGQQLRVARTGLAGIALADDGADLLDAAGQGAHMAFPLLAIAVEQRLDRRADSYSMQYLTALWRIDPEGGIAVGKFDAAANLTIPDDATRARKLAFANEWLEKFRKLDQRQMSPRQRTEIDELMCGAVPLLVPMLAPELICSPEDRELVQLVFRSGFGPIDLCSPACAVPRLPVPPSRCCAQDRPSARASGGAALCRAGPV